MCSMTRSQRLLVWLPLLVSLGACPTRRDDDGRSQTPSSPVAASGGAQTPSAEEQAQQERSSVESTHHVVFADRTSQAYLLLLVSDGPRPTRESLAELVRAKLPAADDEPEAKLLLELVATEPQPSMADPSLSAEERQTLQHRDLLGLHLDLLPVAPAGEEPLIPLEALRDPISTRELSDDERASLPARRYAMVLRAHYRNRYGIRGLRLLQTLVRIVAADRRALIHDPDTGETTGLPAFTRRRLQSTVGNVADQVVVVPFPDPRHGEGFVRLSTRGMRRFGSVDIELDGLPRDPAALDAATHLLYGMAYRMVRMGEYDREGYAVEVDEVVTVTHPDIAQAYSGRSAALPRCEDCLQSVDVHLVERPPEPHDPIEHVVARIVAPREQSDASGYEHPAWVRSALADLLGVR